MSIAAEMKTLTADIIDSYNARVKAVGTIVKDTNDLIKGFNADRNKMAAEQAKSLADFVADLTKNVGNMISNFQKEHKEMANALKASLKKGETDRLKDFNAMMGNIQKEIKEIEDYVAEKLKEFSDSHADMSEALKKDLAKYVADIVSTTKKLLAGFTDEREKMAANWNSLVATMAKKRGVKPEVEAEVKVSPVKEAIEEEVFSEMDLEKLENKVLKFIKKHPGVKVGDMEEPLGVNRTILGKIARKLLDEGKVRKEENLYFPL